MLDFFWSYLSDDTGVAFEISTHKFPVYRKIWAHLNSEKDSRYIECTLGKYCYI